MKITIEKNHDCECMSKDVMTYFYKVVGYGEDVTSSINFRKKTISTAFIADHGKTLGGAYDEVEINFCPLCGRDLRAE